MADKQFLDGIRAFRPNEKAPEYVIANLVINVSELESFLKKQTNNEVKVDLKRSQKGSFYLEVNSWQPKTTNAQPTSNASTANINEPLDDLPF